MPFLEIQTQVELPTDEARQELLKRLSQQVSEHLGKPESYVMCSLQQQSAMVFAGSAEPCCCVTVRAIGTLASAAMEALTGAISQEIERTLGLPAARCFVVFEQVERSHWGIRGAMLG